MDPKESSRVARTAPEGVSGTIRGTSIGKGVAAAAAAAGAAGPQPQMGVVANAHERGFVREAERALGQTGFTEIGQAAVERLRSEYRGLMTELDTPELQQIVTRAAAAAAKYSAMAVADPANAERYKQNVAHAMNTLSNLRAEVQEKFRRAVAESAFSALREVITRVLPAVAGVV